MDGYALACTAWATGMRPPIRQSVSDYADSHRVLPSKGAAEPGKWRTSRTPYLKEIMDVLSVSDSTERIIFMKSAQVGGTEVILNFIAYVIDHAPSPLLIVQPTVDVAERFSKQRVQAMIDVSPTLLDKIPPARSRDSGNTTLMKDFPAGILILTGSNSASGLRSMPIKFLACDEVDAYDLDVDNEGDPVTLAEQRTKTFSRKKIFLNSTPTIKSVSRITAEYEKSDKRRYYVHCPDCDHAQVLKFENLAPLFKEGETQTPYAVHYACEGCGVLISEHHKQNLLANGKWIKEHPEREVAGFHINALYAPLGLGDSWLKIYKTWLDKKDDPVLLKVFTNTILGEAWEEESEKVNSEDLKTRAEDYAIRTPPSGCLILTAGVDVQKDRFAVQILGWGEHETSWVLDWVELPADTATEDGWKVLDDYLNKPIVNACGIDLRLSAVAIDTGYNTHEVYNYCRAHSRKKGRWVLAVKGANMKNKPILGKPSKQDVNWRGQVIKGGVELYNLGTDTAKHSIYARLQSDSKKPYAGDRKIRFSKDLEDSYYDQLTAEVFEPRQGKWIVRDRRIRNEGLDTFVYAYAAALHASVRIHAKSHAEWQRLQSLLEPRQQGLLLAAAPRDPAPAPAPKPRSRENTTIFSLFDD